MKTILALYRGESIAEAKIIAVSVDPDLVSYVAGRLLADKERQEDPVIEKLLRGRRGALQAIKQEAQAENRPADILRVIQREQGEEQ